jgi:hypothetical protein
MTTRLFKQIQKIASLTLGLSRLCILENSRFIPNVRSFSILLLGPPCMPLAVCTIFFTLRWFRSVDYWFSRSHMVNSIVVYGWFFSTRMHVAVQLYAFTCSDHPYNWALFTTPRHAPLYHQSMTNVLICMRVLICYVHTRLFGFYCY